MRLSTPTPVAVGIAAIAMMTISGIDLTAQEQPFHIQPGWPTLPTGRTWGSAGGVDIDPDGASVWVFERCGANTCLGSNLAPIIKLDAQGKVVKTFGDGMIVSPHGLHVARDGSVWVTDFADNQPRRAAGAPADSPLPPAPAKLMGQQVLKFSPEGKLLLALGTPGVTGTTQTTFNQPSAVYTAPNGDIFVADGHGGASNARIVKFSKDGKYVKEWGKKGTGPGEFDNPHALAMDSTGRLFVGDRTNNRVQIFDQEGMFLAEWKQFGRPSGIFIDRNDMLYVTDSQSDEKSNPGFTMGIRIGSAKDGVVKQFIPAVGPDGKPTSTEGVAADAKGNVYGGETGTQNVRRFVK